MRHLFYVVVWSTLTVVCVGICFDGFIRCQSLHSILIAGGAAVGCAILAGWEIKTFLSK